MGSFRKFSRMFLQYHRGIPKNYQNTQTPHAHRKFCCLVRHYMYFRVRAPPGSLRSERTASRCDPAWHTAKTSGALAADLLPALRATTPGLRASKSSGLASHSRTWLTKNGKVAAVAQRSIEKSIRILRENPFLEILKGQNCTTFPVEFERNISVSSTFRVRPDLRGLTPPATPVVLGDPGSTRPFAGTCWARAKALRKHSASPAQRL